MKKHIVIYLLLILIIVILGILIFQSFSRKAVNNLTQLIKENDCEKVNEFLQKHKFLNLNQCGINSILAFMAEQTFCTPLQEACKIGNYNIVVLLIEHGADVNYVNKTAPFSPIMCTVISESEDKVQILELLIKKGGDVNYTYQNIDAAYSIISKRKEILYDTELLEILYDNGLDPYRQYSRGSILHEACYWGYEQIIIYLLNNYKYDVNEKNSLGRTPLMIYCNSYNFDDDRKEIITLFLSKGSNISIRDDNNKSAYDYAWENKYPKDILDLLK